MINKDEWYSIRQIEQQNLIPFLKSKYLVRKWIEAGKLKAVKIGQDSRGRRYAVKGEWIIEFIAKWEAGDFSN